MAKLDNNQRGEYWARFCAVAVFLIGLEVLLGWIFDIPILRSVLPGFVEMKSNTAVGYLCAGASLWLLTPDTRGSGTHAGRVLAAFLVVLGGLTTAQFIFSVDLGIDQLLFSEAAGAVGTTAPNRMALASAVNFILKGIALLWLDWEPKKRFRPSQILSLLSAIAPVQALIGYGYGVQNVFGTGHGYRLVTQMAVHAAAAWLLLSVGTLLARSEAGILRPFARSRDPERLWLKLLLTALIVPPLIGFLVAVGATSGTYDPAFGYSILVIGSVVILSVAIWFAAGRTAKARETEREIQVRLNEKDENLRLSEEMARIALAAGKMGNWDLNVRTGKTTRSQRHDQCFGYDTRLENWSFEDFLRHVHPEDRGKMNDVFKVALERGEDWDFECRVIWPDQSVHWIAVAGRSVLDEEGRPLRAAGLVYDVTERKQAAADLLEAVRARDEFISICSHELRTPVTSLKLQFQMAARQLKKDAATALKREVVEKRVQMTNLQLNRMTALIEEMLDVSRISTGALRMNPAPLDIFLLGREVADRFSGDFTHAGLKLNSERLPASATVLGDAYRIEQVISNLLTNAMKYGKGSTVELSGEILDGRIRFTVTDHGTGIDQIHLDRIFDRFERAISASSISGLGLGLYISRQIIQAHQGQIWAESELGKGSAFTFEIPEFSGQSPIGISAVSPGSAFATAPANDSA